MVRKMVTKMVEKKVQIGVVPNDELLGWKMGMLMVEMKVN